MTSQEHESAMRSKGEDRVSVPPPRSGGLAQMLMDRNNVYWGYRFHGRRISIVVWGLSGILLFFAVSCWMTQDTHLFWLSVIGFVASFITTICWEVHVRRTHRCPSCDHFLAKTEVSEELVENGFRNELIARCPNCGRVWHTRTYTPPPGAGAGGGIGF